MLRTAIGCLALVLAAVTAQPAVIHVGGGGYPTIQQGLNAASDGDTVLVAPGTYTGAENRGLTLGTKNLAVIAEAGAASTIIDCEDADLAFSVDGGQDSTTVIDGFTITHGKGMYAGGMYILQSGPIVRGCVFTDNDGPTSTAGPGGLEIWMSSGARIIGCTFNGNVGTPYVGGAISVILSEASIESCTFENNQNRDGGAIGCGSSSTVTISDCTFTNNSTGPTYYGSGGAIHGQGGSHVVVTGSTFAGNEAPGSSGSGGAVNFSSCASAVIDSCSFSSNAAKYGGAVNASYTALVTVSRSTFSANTASMEGDGGGVMMYDGELQMQGCAFDSNTAGQGGGGVRLQSLAEGSTVSGCEFTGNLSTHSSGGGAALYSCSGLVISGCSFADGHAPGSGGGLHLGSGSPTIIGCNLSGNTAAWGGGVGVQGYDPTFPTLTGCTLTGNTATIEGGALLYAGANAGGTISGCTIVENGAPEGGGIYLDHCAPVSISNTIVAFSTGGAAIGAWDSADPTITHCCVFENAGGDSLIGIHHDNMFVDPLFCDAPGGDYALCADSPCVAANNGWNELVGAHDAGCPNCDDPVAATTWGRIKAMWR